MPAPTASDPPIPRDAFLWRGDHPVLDFLNTEHQRRGHRMDRLDSPEAVRAWLFHAGFPPGPPGPGAEVLEAARRLRSALRRVVESGLPDAAGGAADLSDLNRLLAERPGQFQLQAQGWVLVRTFQPTGPDFLQPLLESALDLLCGPDRRRIRQCRSSTCILLFLDTSRNHSRHWCSMETCGNRAKVAAHARRSRANPGAVHPESPR